MSEERKARWRRLLHEEQEAFDKAVRLSDDAGPAQRALLWQDWLQACHEVLRMYVKSKVVLHPWETSLDPFPAEAFMRIGGLIEAAAIGRLAGPLAEAASTGGRPEYWPAEMRDIATAVYYVEMAKSGRIRDRSYNKTVAEAYGVDRTTVQAWVRDKERLLASMPEPPIDQIAEQLKVAGRRYHFNRTDEKHPEDC